WTPERPVTPCPLCRGHARRRKARVAREYITEGRSTDLRGICGLAMPPARRRSHLGVHSRSAKLGRTHCASSRTLGWFGLPLRPTENIYSTRVKNSCRCGPF